MNYSIIMSFFCLGIAIFDVITYRIPDILLIFFALVMIIIGGSQPHTTLILNLTAASVAFLLFGTVWYFSHGIGLGDVKYAALLGYLLGPERLALAFIITALLGIIIYSLGILLFHWPKTKKIPYAPFLSAGAIISLFYNQNLTGGNI